MFLTACKGMFVMGFLYIALGCDKPTRPQKPAFGIGHVSVGQDNSEGAMYMGNLRRTGAYSVQAVRELKGLLWRFRAPSAIVCFPVVSDGSVFFGCDDDNMYAVDAKDGTLLWKFKTGNDIRSSVAVADGILFFGSNDGDFYAIGIDGKLRWSFHTGGDFFSASLVADGRVCFASDDGFLYAAEMYTGKEMWRYKIPMERPSMPTSPSLQDGLIYLTDDTSQNIYIVDASTGREIRIFT